jgi:hypothetical protein
MTRIALAFGAFLIVGVLCAASAGYAKPGGVGCASAITLASNSSYISDTSTTTNWMTSFGPLVSPANDQLYKLTAGTPPLFPITPTAASYAFAMYLIASCSDSGTEPAPIAATATIGRELSLDGLTPGTVYYVAVTGIAAGGGSADGTVNFSTGYLPVSLQSFVVD